jgi:hypothetical protein
LVEPAVDLVPDPVRAVPDAANSRDVEAFLNGRATSPSTLPVRT